MTLRRRLLSFVLLLTICLGRSVQAAPKQVTKTQKILEKCPHFSPESYTPMCTDARVDPSVRPKDYRCEMMNITIQLLPERFQEIDDVRESLIISSSLRVQWDVPCNDLPMKLKSTAYVDEKNFWKPHLNHKNAENDFGMSHGFTSRFYINVPENSTATFYWARSGVFASTCDLDFTWYPFDENTCSIEFVSLTNVYGAVFQAKVPVVQDNFMPPSSSWTLVDVGSSSGFYNLNGNRSIASIKMKMRRKPEYYIYNLMLPPCFLALLEVGSFFISPSLPDRPVFSCTILLAMSFLRGMVLDKVPPRPQRIFIGTFIDYCTIIAWSCTAYALFTCWLVRVGQKWFQRKVCDCLPLTRISLMDIATCLLTVTAFIMINFYAISVAIAANYFS